MEQQRTLNYPGALAQLTACANNVPREQASTIRSLAQKECENDVKTHDALMARANTMLGSTGVGMSLLVGFSKEGVVDTTIEQACLIAALGFALASVILVLMTLRLRESATVTSNLTLFGRQPFFPRDRSLAPTSTPTPTCIRVE